MRGPPSRSRSSLGRFLSTTTVGITVIAILSGAFGEATFAALLERQWLEIGWLRQYAHPAALVTVVAGITVLAVLFGEPFPSALRYSIPSASSPPSRR